MRNQIEVWMEIHQQVLNSGKPYPTNVSTPIGQQSEAYKKAKALGNEKRRKRNEEKSKR